MTSERDDIINQKIKCATFDIALYPDVEDLVGKIARSVREVLSGAVSTQLKVRISSVTMVDQKDAAVGWSDAYPSFALSTGTPKDTVYIELKPALLSALSGALLGGVFTIADNGEAPGSLDVELSKLAIGKISDVVGRSVSMMTPELAATNLFISETGDSLHELTKGMSATAFLVLTLSVQPEEKEGSSDFSIIFPIDFLDRRGLLEARQQKVVGVSDPSQWQVTMSNNIDETPIDVAAILDRYYTTLSEFSHLQIGSVIPLEENDRFVNLVLKTASGEFAVGKGLLGTHKKTKAVKLVSTQ